MTVELVDVASIPETLKTVLSTQGNLEEVLRWGFSLPAAERHPHVIERFVQQDEFTHDVLVPIRELWLVYDCS